MAPPTRCSRVLERAFTTCSRVVAGSELGRGARRGNGCEEVETEPFGEGLGRQLAADAVAGRVQGRRVRGQPALARGDRHDAAADAALTRNPDLVEPVTGQLVQS